MRVYRRGTHTPAKDSLTVDAVLCRVLRPGHFTADKRYLCFHNMTIVLPEHIPEAPVMLVEKP